MKTQSMITFNRNKDKVEAKNRAIIAENEIASTHTPKRLYLNAKQIWVCDVCGLQNRKMGKVRCINVSPIIDT